MTRMLLYNERKMVNNMENITLGQVATALAFLIGLIGSAKYLIAEFNKKIEKALKPLNDKIDNLELTTDKNFLVRFLSDVEQDSTIDEIEWERFYETYKRYHDLGGNSYIDHKVEKLRKEGKI